MNAPITGYRNLTEAEVALINQIKAKGVEIEALCNQVDRYIDEQYDKAFGVIAVDDPNLDTDTDDPEVARLDSTQPAAWAGEARINFQKALMFLTRAVAHRLGVSSNSLITGGHGVTVGPILLGCAAAAHVLTPSATVRRIINMTALTVVEAGQAQ